MITQYGLDEKLSMKIKESLDRFVKNNNGYEKEISIYKEYPCEPLGENFSFLKVLIVSTKGIFYLIESNEDKKIYRSIIKPICNQIDSIADKAEEGVPVSKIINVDELEEIILNEKDSILSEEEAEEFNSIFQKANSLRKEDIRESREGSIGDSIKKRNNEICKYDKTEFESIYSQKMNCHMRIRGLAGCGKTIVLVKKMAYLHYINPSLKICYVFFTVSLRQYIEGLFEKFYKEFNPGREYDREKIMFFHSWGSKRYTGFYSYVCEMTNNEKESLYDDYGFNNTFSGVCSNLLKKLSEEKLGLFDYVFIDEAQDFPLVFYKLAIRTLNSQGKIIYAYDELQSLYNPNKMPTKKDIFGDEECKDIDLATCYRTPKKILVAAHALGMGIYSKRKEELCNVPEDLSLWKAIGYNSEKAIKYGEHVSLYRNPSRLDKFDDSPQIFIGTCENRINQYSDVSKEIYHLIKYEDVKPDDILIIDLDEINLEDNYQTFKYNNTIYLNKIAGDEERLFGLNLVNKDNALKFRIEGLIPYTTVFRAKGNEAYIVFIINANKKSSLSTVSRNRLFTAMTRAKMLVYIFGTSEIGEYKNELTKTRDNGFKLEFDYPTREELKKQQTIAAAEDSDQKKINQIISLSKEIKEKNDKELIIDIILEQTGCKTIEELEEFIKNGKAIQK